MCLLANRLAIPHQQGGVGRFPKELVRMLSKPRRSRRGFFWLWLFVQSRYGGRPGRAIDIHHLRAAQSACSVAFDVRSSLDAIALYAWRLDVFVLKLTRTIRSPFLALTRVELIQKLLQPERL